ncbi:MAG: transglycosylase SLT domain-containing protein [Prevotella sp.]|nr:transglycosylase SLT domain-containing protein [Prevotella sp.]
MTRRLIISKRQANWLVKWFLPFYLLTFLPLSLHAQVEIDDVDVESEEEEETTDVRIEDEIAVTDKDGNEEVIEFPEAMTYDLDSLLNLYMSKTYLGTLGDCNMKNENPTFPREVYIERLQRIPSVMEMAYNDIVQRFIDRYAGRLRYSVSYMLGAFNFYVPIFEEALEAYQIPLELKYLPIIESALNPKAVSRVGAGGLWQFMPATAKQYGLTINSLVDERRDPVKASYAAAHLLSDLYRIFGDWNLVIAAYNCGPQNIKKAIQRHRAAKGRTEDDAITAEDKDYWQLYPYLPAETRGYVPAFIAANYIMTYYCEHNICPMTTRLPLQTDTVVVTKNVHLGQIAGALGIDIEQLRALNPEYRHDIVPGLTKPSAIKMTISDVGNFIDHEDSIYNYRASEFLTKRAVVDVNDDVPTFSRSRRSAYNRSGRRSARSARNARGSRSSRSVAAGTSITIKKGQTLSEIAKRNGTTVAKLKQLNGIKGNNIQAGKKLRVK